MEVQPLPISRWTLAFQFFSIFFSRGSRFSTNFKTKRFMIQKSTTLSGKICKTLSFNRLMHNLCAYPLLIIKINTCFIPKTWLRSFKLWQCCKGKKQRAGKSPPAVLISYVFRSVDQPPWFGAPLKISRNAFFPWSSLPFINVFPCFFFHLRGFVRHETSETMEYVASPILWLNAGAQITHDG